MFDQGIVRFGSCCKERFAGIPEVSVAGDWSAQATSSQVDSDEVETITNLIVGVGQHPSKRRVISLAIPLHKLGERQADQDTRSSWLIQKWTNSTLQESAHAVNLCKYGQLTDGSRAGILVTPIVTVLPLVGLSQSIGTSRLPHSRPGA